jgi:hypothetical protein
MATDKQTVQDRRWSTAYSLRRRHKFGYLSYFTAFLCDSHRKVCICFQAVLQQTHSCPNSSTSLQYARIKHSAYRVHRSHNVCCRLTQICGDMPGHQPRGARQTLTLYSPMANICTAQWSLYVPHSGHYMYRTLVTICTAHWSLYVPHSGHYTYRTVVTICTAHWSLYVPPVSNSTILRSAHTVYLCVLCGFQNKQRLFPYTALTDWFV